MRNTWKWLGAAGLVIGLAGCGGGGESPEAQPEGVNAALDTIDAAGGRVVGKSGVTLDIPEGALAAPVTLRIAADAAGAPPLPASMRPAGEVWAVTPGGPPLARPVELRIPRPKAAIPEDEELALVQADAAGRWQAVGTLDKASGELVAPVQRLGHFAVVSVPQPGKAAPATALPIQYTLSVSCASGPCNDLPSVPTSVTWTVKSNKGVFPATCVNPQLLISKPEDWLQFVTLPLSGGTLSRTLTRPGTSLLTGISASIYLSCANDPVKKGLGSAGVQWRTPTYPALKVDLSPPAQQAAPGQSLTISALFIGASVATVQGYTPPTPENRAVVTWERSDDDGLSWRAFATSYQDESPDSQPVSTLPKWFTWKMSTRLAVVAADANALFRARACYTPPDLKAPPCVATRPARLTLVNAPTLPEIKTPPRPLRVVAGQTASFSVGVSGLPAPTLQWQQRPANSTASWTNISGATAPGYTTGVLSLANNGQQFRVVATNSVGSTPSQPVTVSVDAKAVAPTIVNPPLAIRVITGSDAVFAVRASGTDALSFQWRRNGVNLSGANAAVLRLTAVDATRAGDYSVVVTNAVGSVTSAVARLTVSAVPVTVVPPTIVAGPAAASLAQGQSVTFTVGVTGTGPFTYQWRRNGTSISGATRAGYTIASVQPANAGSYSVVVSSGGVNVTSAAAALTVTAVAPPTAPTITTQPVSVVVVPGATTTLAVAANGTGPLSYQWFQDGSPITSSSSNSPALTLDSIASLSSGSYTVTVSNAIGSVTSAPAELLVAGAPQVGTVADVYEVPEGGIGEFSISASGSGLRYQWTRNGIAIPGATEATYATPVLTLADSGAVYGVIVYNGAGVAIVQGTVLTVTPAGPPPGMVLFAGDFSSAGTTIGTGTAARFDNPQGLTADAAGNLFVASSNGKFVSKIDPGGAVTHLFFAPITATSFFANPALAPDGSLFVGSASWCGLWRAAPPLSAPTTVAEITLANCPVFGSNGLSVDPQGRVAIADTSRHAIILATQQPGGAWTQTYFAGGTNYFDGDANRGSTDATGTAARFSGPTGLAHAPNGDLYVADHDNGTIRRITPAGEVSTFAGAAGQQSTLDGTGTAARFDRPYGLAFDPDGNLIVLTLGASGAEPAWVRRITMGGVVTTLFDARAEAAALATDGNAVANARSVKGIAAPGSKRIAISAGNAVLLRTLP